MASLFKSSLTVGFNWWMLIAPLMICLAVVIAWKRYNLAPKSLKIVDRLKNEKGEKIAIFLSAILSIDFFFESFTGLVQLGTNSLADNESAAWGLLSPIFWAFGFFLCFAALLILVIELVSSIRYKRLIEIRKYVRMKQRARRDARPYETKEKTVAREDDMEQELHAVTMDSKEGTVNFQ